MRIKEKIREIFRPRLKLEKGTRFVSFLFIAVSIAISGLILWAANMYYNIDTGEVVVDEFQRVTNILRATAGLIVGGTATQNPSAGYVFEVVGSSKLASTTLATTTIATGPLTLSAANQELRFTGGTSYYVGIKAPTSLSTTSVYTLPANYPGGTGYILTSDTSGNLSWTQAGTGGIGDITAVGDCASGDCFTQTGGSGNNLWFITGGGGRIQLTGASTASNYTVTLPAANGTIALGSGATNYVAYWTGANTLGAEQYLSTSRGGIGTSSATWTGLVRVSGGSWSPLTGTTSSLAYWSTYSQIGSFPFGTAGQLLVSQGSGNVATWTVATYPTTVAAANQAIYSSGANAFTVGTLPVAAGGTGRTSWTQWGVLYADGSTSLNNVATSTTYAILTANSSATPSWRTISELISATNGLTATGTTQLTLKLGGTLSEPTTIALSSYDLIFKLTGTGNFRVQNAAGTDTLVVNDSGQILYKTYPLAQTGKQVLREMAPIMGFDLPFRCANACNTATTVSRTIEDYPFSAAETGATRVHKFVIRYADTGTTTPSTWIVYNETDATTTATFTVPATNSDLAKGKVYITSNVSIPGSGKRWHLRLQTPSGMTIQVYEIYLAAYDQLP
jgi:hypothetical protein